MQKESIARYRSKATELPNRHQPHQRYGKWIARLIPIILVSALLSVNTFATETGISHHRVQQTIQPQLQVFEGRVQALNQATVAAQTHGQVTDLLVDVGDSVSKGEIIARLTKIEQAAQLEAAYSLEKKSLAQLLEAQKTFERIEQMQSKQLLSQADYDRAKANLKTAEATKKQASTAIDSARQNLSYTTIEAPFSGIVAERLIRKGEIVSPGVPIMRGVSLEHLRIHVSIPQSAYGPIKKAGSASIILPSGALLALQDMRFSPDANQYNAFDLFIDLPLGQSNLAPGMLVKVGFSHQSKPQIWIPTASIVKRGAIRAVYVQSEQGPNHYALRYIKTSTQMADRTLVLSGLNPLEQIALAPELIRAQITTKTETRK